MAQSGCLDDIDDLLYALRGAARLGVSRRGFAEAAELSPRELVELEVRAGVRLGY